MCDEIHDRCIFPEQLSACDGLPEGQACILGEFQWFCSQGVCLPNECGDGVARGNEDCDSADLGGQTCESQGFTGGTLACQQDCQFHYAGCFGGCGDGALDPGEACDGTMFADVSCAQVGFDRGVLLCDSSCQVDVSECGRFGWAAMDVPELADANYVGIWGTSSSNVYAVGETSTGTGFEGVLVRYDGVVWSRLVLPYQGPLQSIWGSGPNDVYVAGHDQSFLHFDGSQWSAVQGAPTGGVTSLWGTGPDEVWAVVDFQIWRFDGAGWSVLDTGSLWPIEQVWASSASDIYGSDSGFASPILHFNGVDWESQSLGSQYGVKHLWGSSSTSVYAIGFNPPQEDALFHSDGSTWTEVAAVSNRPGQTLTGIWGSGADDVFVVSSDDGAWHLDGPSWLHMDVAGPLQGGQFEAVWGDGHGTVFAVGDGIYRFSGVSWSQVQQPGVTEPVFRVTGAGPDDLYVLHSASGGYSGSVRHFDGDTWLPAFDQLCDQIADIFSFPTGEMFLSCVVPSGPEVLIFYFDGSSTQVDFEWASMGDPSWGISFLWGTSPAEMWGIGTDGWVFRRTQGAWQADQSLPSQARPNGFHGAHANYVVVVGNAGFIARNAGASWEQQSSPTTQDLHDVWCASQTRCWAVGEGGVIVRWGGTTWEVDPSITSHSLFAVWGRGPGDVFAGGEHGTLLHYDGDHWEHWRSGTPYEILDIWGSGRSDVHLVGGGGTLLRLLVTDTP
ncbi:MAG: hypothetical protein ABI333_30665 [bacterium]